jgi:CBS domain-containing protein
MNIGEICSREVYVAKPSEPLAEAAREMCRRNVGTVVVVERQGELVRPIGIVTDRDIVRALVQRAARIDELEIGSVMTWSPLALREDSEIGEAIEFLSESTIRRAPVISDTGDLVGIVSIDDLLPIVSEELGALTRLIARQTGHRTRRGGLSQPRPLSPMRHDS